MFLIRWDIWKLKYSHSEDLIQQFLCGSRLFQSLFYLSHNFLWENSQILRFDKVRPHIGAFLYKNSRDHGQKSLKKIWRFKTLKGHFEINGTLNPFEPVQNNFRSIERRWKNHKNLPQVDHFVLPNVRQYLHADPWNWRLIFWPFTEIQNQEFHSEIVL